MSIDKFESFLVSKKNNWPEAYEKMALPMPLIAKIQSVNDIRIGQIMAEYGLQATDFGILSALRRSTKPYILAPKQLMEHMLISSGGLTKALHRLENHEMISRPNYHKDGRVKCVQLTNKGKVTIEEIMVKAQQTHELLRNTLSEQEVSQLTLTLKKLLSAMETFE